MVQTDFRSRLKKLFSNQAAYVNLGGNKMKVIDINDRQLNSTPNNFQFQDFDRFGRLYSTLSYGSAYSPIVAMSYQLAKIELYKSYEDMDRDSILATALDIYSDSVTQENEYGDILRIQSNNQNVQDVLTNLFHDILNIDFNLWTWVRNMMKYGDFYLKLNILDGHGIVNVQPLSTYSMIRVEDLYNPNQEIKFIYDPSFGIDHGMYGRNVQNFDDYEIAHFRLISDSNFLPYGRSLLEPARKSWEQLVMLEDAMLINRIMRAPSKRIFKIDIGNIPPNEIDNYMEQLVAKMKKVPYVDEQTGQYNLKFNLQPVRDNTLIPLIDGRTITIKELKEECDLGKKNYVYSVDRENGNKIAAGEVERCVLTKENADICRVTLDDDSYIDFEPNHPVMLRNGEYKAAKYLLENERLMPFYTQKSNEFRLKDYEMILDPCDEKYKYTHRVVAEQFGIKQKGKVIHHINFNKRDNTPKNLNGSMTFSEHWEYHKIFLQEMRNSWSKEKKAEIYAKMGIAISKAYTKERRERHSMLMRGRKNPNQSKRMILNNPSTLVYVKEMKKRTMPDENRKRWANKEYKEKVILGMSHTFDDYLIYEIKKLIKINNVTKTYQLIKILNSNQILLDYFNELNKTKKNSGKFTKYSINTFILRLGYTTYDDFYSEVRNMKDIVCNHKVKKVEMLAEKADVYCMQVKDFHNFAIVAHGSNSGIFTKNSMMEDFYLPVRGGNSGTSIETLDGLEFTGIDDIEYIKNRMLAALRIPKAFIGYDESVEGKCLAPDTKIMLYNGGTLTIKEISDLFLIKEDPDLWVHSFDFETNSVIPTKIKLAEKTRLNAQVVRVYLNNNTYIDCTPDHHFILIDGTQIEAQNLQPEDLLLGIAHNHSIDKIEWLDEKIDTYNLEVNHKCHNYLIKNDIFISNSTLAAEDLRFAASAGRAQKIVLSELYKIALIHLYCQGFKNEDLIDFTLRLTPASTIYEKEKIEVWKSKLDVAQAALDQKILPRKWIYENVFHMAEAEWDVTQENIIDDAKYAYRLEQINSKGVDPKSEIQLEKEKLLGSESGDKPKEKPEGDSNEEPNKPTEKTDKEKPIEKKPLTPKKGNEKEPEKATKKTEKKPGEESKKKKPLTAGYESPFSDIYGSKDGRNDYKLDASVTHRYNGGSSIAVDNINKKESGISKLLLESENFENNLKILLKK